MMDDILLDERVDDKLADLARNVAAAAKFAAAAGDEDGFLTLDGVEAVVAAADGYHNLQAELRAEMRRSNVIDVENDATLVVLRYIGRVIGDSEWPR